MDHRCNEHTGVALMSTGVGDGRKSFFHRGIRSAAAGGLMASLLAACGSSAAAARAPATAKSGKVPAYSLQATWSAVGPTPHFTAVLPSAHKVFATNLGAGTVTVLSSSGKKLGQVHTGGTVHTVMVDRKNRMVYVTDIARGYLDVINGATNALTAQIHVAKHLHGLAVSNRLGLAVVTDVALSKAYVVNIRTNKVLTPAGIAVGANPWGVAIDPKADLAFVANTGVDPFASSPSLANNPAGDSVSVVNLRTDRVISTITVGPHPWNLVVGRSGTVYVGVVGTKRVAVIRSDKVVTDIPVPGTPHGIGYWRSRGLIFVNDTSTNQTSVIQASSAKVVQNISVGSQPQGLSVNPANGKVYVANQAAQTVSVLAPKP